MSEHRSSWRFWVAISIAVLLLAGLVSLPIRYLRAREPSPSRPSAAPGWLAAHSGPDHGLYAEAGQPLPCGPQAKTARDFDQVKLAWARANFAEAYKQVGRRSPKWDKDALEGLELMAQTTLDPQRMAVAVAIPNWGETRDMGKPLLPALDAGCDDPMVLYGAGMSQWYYGKYAEGEALLRRAVEGLKTTKYPRARAWVVPWKLAEMQAFMLHPPEPPELRRPVTPEELEKRKLSDPYLDLAAQWLVEGLAEPHQTPGWQRALYALVASAWQPGELFRARGPALAKAAAARPGADPWLVAMLNAEAEFHTAWDARGGGYADTVTEAGWRVYHEHVPRAYRYFAQAYQLHPEFPEAATALIGTDILADHPNESPRQWFDRAVAAQGDYFSAYLGFLYTLLPRWGGTHDDMYKFGKECLATQRFDTLVPMMMMMVGLWDYSGDKDRQFWQRPGVWEDMRAMFDGYLAEPKAPLEPRIWKTHYLAVAYLCGQEPVVKRLLSELGSGADYTLLTTSWEIDRAKMMQGRPPLPPSPPPPGPVTDAKVARERGDSTQALALYEKVVKEDRRPDDNQLKRYERGDVLNCRLEVALMKGGWVDLTPTPELLGWQGRATDWRVPAPGVLEGPPTPATAILMGKLRAPDNYELRCEVDLPPWSNAQFMVGYDTNMHGAEVILKPGLAPAVLLTGNRKPIGAADQQYLRDKNQVVAQMWEGKIWAYVNGACLVAGAPVAGTRGGPPGHVIGLEATSGKQGPAVFRHLKMRKLTAPPSPPA